MRKVADVADDLQNEFWGWSEEVLSELGRS